jgi:hypothetical protein
MKRRALALTLGALVGLVACSAGDDLASSEAENGTGGPAAIHPGWYKTPEAITETISGAWELSLTNEERAQYIHNVRASLGGVNVSAQGALVEKPHELYALSLHSLSEMLAVRLMKKELEKEAAGQPYMFDGLGFSEADDGCYDDDARAWCDGKDDVKIGSLTIGGVDPANLTKAMRKRLMHKMQSIGEFFLMAIDDKTTLGDSHAPAFLLDEVFLPKLREGALSPDQEMLAWQEVVYTILMSGYFFDLPADP